MNKILIKNEGKYTQLWIDDKYQCGWNQFDIPGEVADRVLGMIQEGIDFGKEERTKEIKATAEQLGELLGIKNAL